MAAERDRLAARVAELEARSEESVHRDARIRELEAALAARDENVLQLQGELGRKNDRLRALEVELADARHAAETGRDDLRRIKGIGPSFEKALIALGVTTYEQIAAWKDSDIDAIAAEINANPNRIRRDDWVKSARMQQALKRQNG